MYTNFSYAHLSIYVPQSIGNDSFVDIDIICRSTGSTGSVIGHDFSIDATDYYKDNLKMLCGASFSNVGCNLGVILINDAINNKIINNYLNGFGAFVCGGSFSCRSCGLNCLNYKQHSILFNGTGNGVIIHCLMLIMTILMVDGHIYAVFDTSYTGNDKSR